MSLAHPQFRECRLARTHLPLRQLRRLRHAGPAPSNWALFAHVVPSNYRDRRQPIRPMAPPGVEASQVAGLLRRLGGSGWRAVAEMDGGSLHQWGAQHRTTMSLAGESFELRPLPPFLKTWDPGFTAAYFRPERLTLRPAAADLPIRTCARSCRKPLAMLLAPPWTGEPARRFAPALRPALPPAPAAASFRTQR